MTLTYACVCSGLSAATVAWHPLGMRPKFFAEVASFPSRVLAARWPGVPNLGDLTKIGAEHGPVDVLVGGTPCQSFSVAGGRAGLDDPRGHLAIEFVRLALRLRARWLVWENVPGVLSSGGGRDFGDLLGVMADAGFGVAYRVLDAQWFGLAQRRRRVFVVGHLGDWRPPAAVLLERPSMQGNPAARRGPRADAAAGAARGAGEVGDGRRGGAGGAVNELTARGTRLDPSTEPYVTGTLGAHHARNAPDDALVAQVGAGPRAPAVAGTVTAGNGQHTRLDAPLVTGALRACAGKSTSSVGPLIADTLRSQGRAPDHGMIVLPIQDANRSRVRRQNGIGVGGDGDPMFTGGTRLDHAVLAFHATQDPISDSRAVPCLGTEPGSIGVLSFDEQQITSADNRARPVPEAPAPTLSPLGRIDVASEAARPRRLTPREWERLMGFPDDYSLVDGAADSVRYEALGNSIATTVLAWVGRRLLIVDEIVRGLGVNRDTVGDSDGG